MSLSLVTMLTFLRSEVECCLSMNRPHVWMCLRYASCQLYDVSTSTIIEIPRVKARFWSGNTSAIDVGKIFGFLRDRILLSSLTIVMSTILSSEWLVKQNSWIIGSRYLKIGNFDFWDLTLFILFFFCYLIVYVKSLKFDLIEIKFIWVESGSSNFTILLWAIGRYIYLSFKKV